MHQENIQLNAELNDLVEKSKQNKTLINQLGQYHRSSYMVELTGIPSQNNEKKKKNFMAPFYGWGSTASRLEPL